MVDRDLFSQRSRILLIVASPHDGMDFRLPGSYGENIRVSSMRLRVWREANVLDQSRSPELYEILP